MTWSVTTFRMATAVFALSLVGACGGGGGSGSTAPTSPVASTPPPGATSQQDVQKIAMDLWHDNNLQQHPKGSCAGCHGADFYDLAISGSTDLDIERRALIDGATQSEAEALVAAIAKMRLDENLPAANARAFRPFQPGGEVLLPDLEGPSYIQSVERDIAFGEQLRDLLPTLFGPRIDSLEDAIKARDEMLDIAHGSNLAGANYRNVQLRDLKIGITFPLWSADVHHGPEEGTFNDWIGDVAHDPKPEYAEEWREIQDAYLANPSRANFWRMYSASMQMTEMKLLNECTVTARNIEAACSSAPKFAGHKFRAALIGQHLLRLSQLSYDTGFAEGAIAFSYLNDDPEFAFLQDFLQEYKDTEFLPSDLWEIGDLARTMLSLDQDTGSFKQMLAELGFPQFVQDSIDANRTEDIEQHALRLPWFWMGFTYDPSFARISQSNASNSGEYMVGTLIQENLFIHNSFQTNMRLLVKGFVQEGTVGKTGQNGSLRTEYLPPEYRMNYRYFTKYGRTVLRWNEDVKEGISIPQALKDEQAELWHKMTANAFRMNLYFYAESLENGGEIAEDSIYPIKAHFDEYEPEHAVEDYALLNRVKTLTGDPELYVVGY